MLRKVCYPQPGTSTRSPNETQTPNATTAALLRKLHSLRRLAPEGHFRIYEAIFGWLSGLLRSTDAKPSVPHPKSLLCMCLRRFPAVLAEIEAWDRHDAEENGTVSIWDSSNACVELYGQLEAFGSTETGWEPLKLVVRAHALSMLVNAVNEGHFEPEFVSLLAELYLGFKCNQDAAAIVKNIPSQIAKPRSSQDTLEGTSTLQPLAIIVDSLEGPGRPREAFDCLSSLIKSEKLPLEWLYTKRFQRVWAATLEALSTGNPEPSATEFTCCVVEQLSLNTGGDGLSKHDTKKQALVNVVAGLTGTAMAFERGASPVRGFVARRLMHILDRCLHHLQFKTEAVNEGSLLVLATARYVAMCKSNYLESAIRRKAEDACRRQLVADDGVSSQVQYQESLFLVCSIAQCQRRACSMVGHDALSEICGRLEQLGLPDWFRGGLRVDGAFLLAQKTNDLRDLAFAERLPTASRGLIEKNTIFSGWRWEEDICEWVLKSPKPKVHVKNVPNSGRHNQAPGWREQERGRVCVRERLGRGRGPSKSSTSGVIRSGLEDCDVGEDENSGQQGQGQGQNEDGDGGDTSSGDELGHDWEEEDFTGIGRLSMGNAARTGILAGGDGDPRWRKTDCSGIKDWHEDGAERASNAMTTRAAAIGHDRRRLVGVGDVEAGDAGDGDASRFEASRSDASRQESQRKKKSSSSAGQTLSEKSRWRSQLWSQSQLQSHSQALQGVESEACGRGRPTKRKKRAGTRTLAGTRAGRRGIGLEKGGSLGGDWGDSDDELL